MNKTFKIKIDVFGLVINCYCGELDGFTEKFGIPKEAFSSGADGAAVLYEGQHYLWLSGNDLYNVVPHEALHLVYDIFSLTGIYFDENNHEHAAYLLGYITECIFKELI